MTDPDLRPGRTRGTERKGAATKILVLGGSPKGETSVTMQYVRFLERSFPEHALEVVQISQRIRRLEREEGLFADTIGRVRAADVVLWATPVYYFPVPSQLKRFVELVHERGAAPVFAGRAAAASSRRSPTA